MWAELEIALWVTLSCSRPSHAGSIRVLLAFGSESDPNSNQPGPLAHLTRATCDIGTSTPPPHAMHHSEDSCSQWVGNAYKNISLHD